MGLEQASTVSFTKEKPQKSSGIFSEKITANGTQETDLIKRIGRRSERTANFFVKLKTISKQKNSNVSEIKRRSYSNKKKYYDKIEGGTRIWQSSKISLEFDRPALKKKIKSKFNN